jgi:hypothetical protein
MRRGIYEDRLRLTRQCKAAMIPPKTAAATTMLIPMMLAPTTRPK